MIDAAEIERLVKLEKDAKKAPWAYRTGLGFCVQKDGEWFASDFTWRECALVASLRNNAAALLQSARFALKARELLERLVVRYEADVWCSDGADCDIEEARALLAEET